MIWPKYPWNSPIRLKSKSRQHKAQEILGLIRLLDFSTRILTWEKLAHYAEFLAPHRPNKLWTPLQSVSMESFDNENEDKRTQQASHFSFLSPPLFNVHVIGVFWMFYKGTISLSRCCPPRCKGRLWRLSKFLITRTIKLLMSERLFS